MAKYCYDYPRPALTTDMIILTYYKFMDFNNFSICDILALIEYTYNWVIFSEISVIWFKNSLAITINDNILYKEADLLVINKVIQSCGFKS